ncbi:MAG: Gfo/Idh/MocA family protein [bacterium]
MAKKIGVAILSFAFGHARMCTEAIQEFEDARVIGVWDDYPERGSEAAGRYNLPFTSKLDEILGRDDVDAVIICSETDKHADLVEEAAKAGKHILCQKPMAYTLSDCDRIIRAVEKYKIKFMMAYQMRHDPVNKKMKELIDEGAIGKVALLRRRHSGPWLLTSREHIKHPYSAWEFDYRRTPGTFMYEGVHAADFFRWFLGDPVSVTAQMDDLLAGLKMDDFGVAIYRFKNREIGVHITSGSILAAESTTEIYGEKGVIIQNYGDGSSTTIPRDEGAVALKMYSTDFVEKKWKKFDFSPHVQQWERIKAVPRPFIDCIKNNEEPQITAMDGKKAVEMILGAYESARKGQTIKFPLEGGSLNTER